MAQTCSELYNLYLSDSKTNGREVSQDINRFVQWCGKTTSIDRLTPHTIANYAAWIGIQGGDVPKKLIPVKAFLAYLKKHEIIQFNLASHLRAPKTRTRSKAAAAAANDRAELTREGYDDLVARLNELKGERVNIVADIGKAMADKDFRENAPLDAAKERQGFTESMIRNLEHTLSKAVIRDSTSKRHKFVTIGTKVSLKNMGRSEKVTYTLVHPSEANISEGKLSSESPVGKALLNRRKGDEVEVIIPKGTIRYKLERIQN
ncbi:hypothetical protein FIM04_03190 [SAR202 cluster bacterium AC-409-J13_OGT_754m]|nr:hypothetical protein [SAR202 cluster bacterium AC-409-J13_OGT_754m]